MKAKPGQQAAQRPPAVSTISPQLRQSGGSTASSIAAGMHANTSRAGGQHRTHCGLRPTDAASTTRPAESAGRVRLLQHTSPVPGRSDGSAVPSDGFRSTGRAALALHTRCDGPRPLLVFDRAVLRRRRERAARDWQPRLPQARDREPPGRPPRRRAPDLAHALDLGSHGDEFAAALADRKTVGWLVRADLGHGFAWLARGSAVVADEEFLPFAPKSFDLVVSAMDLHWVNDLPGTLVQIQRILRPDGLLLGAMLGGATLWQLRQALTAAESEVEGGLSPRVSPFADLRDAAPAAARGLRPAGGRQRDHRGRVRQCALPDARPRRHGREQPGGRAPAAPRAAGHAPARGEIYGERFALPSGRVAASFEVLFLHGWAPHESQPSRSARAARRSGWPTRSAPPSKAPAKKRGEARSCDCR